MAAWTHTSGVLQASASNSGSGTTTSSSLDNTTGGGAIITAKITNGGTGPTIACTATLNISPDNSTWKVWETQTAGVTASIVYSLTFRLPPEAMYGQVVFSGNTAQAVTVEAQFQQVTGFA